MISGSGDVGVRVERGRAGQGGVNIAVEGLEVRKQECKNWRRFVRYIVGFIMKQLSWCEMCGCIISSGIIFDSNIPSFFVICLRFGSW